MLFVIPSAPDSNFKEPEIPISDLPHCKSCGGLLRPHIVWFGENLEEDVLKATGMSISLIRLYR